MRNLKKSSSTLEFVRAFLFKIHCVSLGLQWLEQLYDFFKISKISVVVCEARRKKSTHKSRTEISTSYLEEVRGAVFEL